MHFFHRHVIPADIFTLAENYRSFQNMFQFPDITRPGAFHQVGHSIRSQAFFFQLVLYFEFFQKAIAQQRNIFGMPAQRWRIDFHHIQPVVEVFPETICCHRLLDINIGGADNPYIDINGFLATHPFKFLLLNNPQYLRLEIHIHFADLIQKQGAMISQFKFSQPPFVGPGKGPLFMTEQLTFQ